SGMGERDDQKLLDIEPKWPGRIAHQMRAALGEDSGLPRAGGGADEHAAIDGIDRLKLPRRPLPRFTAHRSLSPSAGPGFSPCLARSDPDTRSLETQTGKPRGIRNSGRARLLPSDTVEHQFVHREF